MHPIGRRASGLTMNVYAGAFTPGKTKVRSRFLSDNGVRWLYRALDEEPANWRHCYKLLLLTGQRRSAISDLRWSQVYDGPKPYILYQSAQTKNNTPYTIPLSPTAMVEVEAARKLAGDSKFVFPADGDVNAQTSINGFSKVHERIYFNTLMVAHSECPGAVWDELLPYWTPHDFRRTMRTFMSRAENRIKKHVSEALISHNNGKSQLDATYDLWEYDPEKRRALTLWGKRVKEITA